MLRASSVPSTRLLSMEEAACRLGVEPAAVRRFVRQMLLRPVEADSGAVWESDVERLHRVLERHGACGLP